ncbi:hypothetical protein L915_03996, partial [Phytophthora nicotianae]
KIRYLDQLLKGSHIGKSGVSSDSKYFVRIPFNFRNVNRTK